MLHRGRASPADEAASTTRFYRAFLAMYVGDERGWSRGRTPIRRMDGTRLELLLPEPPR